MSIFGKPKKQASPEVSAIVSVANKHQAQAQQQRALGAELDIRAFELSNVDSA
jgi:hypothetical protein